MKHLSAGVEDSIKSSDDWLGLGDNENLASNASQLSSSSSSSKPKVQAADAIASSDAQASGKDNWLGLGDEDLGEEKQMSNLAAVPVKRSKEPKSKAIFFMKSISITLKKVCFTDRNIGYY